MADTTSLLASAVLTASLTNPGAAPSVPGRIQLLPLGSFVARDGRPSGMKGVAARAWRCTREDAAALISRWQSRATPVVVDYEHQTHKSDDNGQPAPAAGWITELHLEADGLYASVDWTDRAREYIRAKEYRYVSPTIRFDFSSGAVLDIVSVALTNYPALDGMDAAQAKTQGDTHMDKLLALLRTLLGLPADATEAQCTEALTALPQESLPALLKAREAELANLKRQADAQPDPAKYAPVALLTATQQQLAAVQAELQKLQEGAATAGLAAEVEVALKDGRLHATGRDWALGLAKSAPDVLREYLRTAPTIAALKGTQTAGKDMGEDAASPLSAEERYACAQLGMSAEEYCKCKKEHN